MMDNKKTLIIIAAVLALIIIGAVVYFLTRVPRTSEKSGGSEGFFSFLFPSGGTREGILPDESPKPGDQNGTGTSIGQPTRNLVQLTDNAISGAAFSDKSQKVLYFEKSTGHLFGIQPQGTKKEQLSITTIPRIFEVAWNKDASRAILKYPETTADGTTEIRTFITYPLATSTKEVTGIFLPQDANSAIFSPAEEKIFYLILGQESASGIIAGPENKDPKQVFTSPFGEFLAFWPKKENIILLTKPSSSADGYLYEIDQKNKTLSKILGEVKGLTVLASSNFDKILYSESGRGFLTVRIYDISKKTSNNFGYVTMPEKCFWGKKNIGRIYCGVPKALSSPSYPDDWYKGLTSFSDSLWQIDTINGATKALIDGSDMDMINLFSDTEENYIFFQNKKDGTLCSLKLE